jgi:hypothetical protein
MGFKINLAIVLAVFCGLASYADYFTGFVWYRAEPEFSRIVLSQETIRGHKAVDGFIAKKDEYAKAGKYSTDDDKAGTKTIVRKESMDGHAVETRITIEPPPGHGLGGALPRIHVTVLVDSIKKIDCPLGPAPDKFEKAISQMVIHVDDGVIVVETEGGSVATLTEKQNDGVIVWENEKLVEKSKKADEEKLKRMERQKLKLAEREKERQKKLLQRYDLNGDGKLDPDERARAEKDTKAGLEAPAIEE